MNKFKIYFRLFVILTFTLLQPAFAQEKDLDELEGLREDIQIINLLNGLDLRKEQMEFIIQEAGNVRDIRTSTLNDITVYKSEMLKAYDAIKQEVETGRVTVEKEDAVRFNEIKHRIEEITKDAQMRIDKIAEEVEINLEEFQLIVLDGYKPCIIPIMNKGRIGQSDAGIGITKVLERVKAAPEVKYTQNKDEFIMRVLDRIKTKLPPSLELDETKAGIEISDAFEKVRNMDDVDFQVQKTSIAEELGERILPQKPGLNRKDKIKRFLLSKNVISILEAKINKSQQDNE